MDAVLAAKKPPLLESGHVLVITSELYSASTGSAVVMRNLIREFAPGSLTVLTRHVPPAASAQFPSEYRVRALRTGSPLRRGDRFWRDLARPWIERRMAKIVRDVQPALILAVYPSLHFFAGALAAARQNNIPWVAYLHDLPAEPYEGTKYENWARAVQQTMFDAARGILVANANMAHHLQTKYSVPSVPIEIGYCEPIPATLAPPPAGPPRAFMGGSIYSTNHKTVQRLINGVHQAGAEFTVATHAEWRSLERWGILPRPGLTKALFSARKDYLDALQNHHLLTVGLNWPDESDIHEEELATAFPTKTVEYLASGRPILVHCPEHYGLARFVREHACGIVVADRDVDALAAGARKLLQGGPEVEQMRANALKAAQLFSMDRISAQLRYQLNTMMHG